MQPTPSHTQTITHPQIGPARMRQMSLRVSQFRQIANAPLMRHTYCADASPGFADSPIPTVTSTLPPSPFPSSFFLFPFPFRWPPLNT